MTGSAQNILILLTGKAVTDPIFVQKVTAKFQHNQDSAITVHRHVLDRVASGAAKLTDGSFNKIVYIPSSSDEVDAVFTNPVVLAALHKTLLPKGTLETISISSPSHSEIENGATESIVTPVMITKAIIAGFLQTKDKTGFEKSDVSLVGSTAAIVRRPKKANADGSSSDASAVKIPIFKRSSEASSVAPSVSVATKRPADQLSSGVVKLSLDDDLEEEETEAPFKLNNNIISIDGDDDLVDEDELIGGSLSTPIVLPPKCDPGPGKRRKKACKDCSCGLRELEIAEEEEQRKKQNTVILNLDGSANGGDDDYAIDFTVPGEPVGSCGSCALGDAFRCDGCPYLGLPPFKPGEIVNISAIKNDA